jgi:hypothetical protein
MRLISAPTKINAAGTPPKTIEEFIGKVNSNSGEISIARMRSPKGWHEPGQTPKFTEYTVVLRGTLVIETKTGLSEIHENQAVIIDKDEWVQYSTPYENGAEYIAVCLPAFSPKLVNRDKE